LEESFIILKTPCGISYNQTTPQGVCQKGILVGLHFFIIAELFQNTTAGLQDKNGYGKMPPGRVAVSVSAKVSCGLRR
jgi:hypothetical protein